MALQFFDISSKAGFDTISRRDAHDRLAASAEDAGIPDIVWEAVWILALDGNKEARLSLEELIQVEIVGTDGF